ncbi:50S ribosomal protein L27, partial [Dysosmobacter welbionis]
PGGKGRPAVLCPGTRHRRGLRREHLSSGRLHPLRPGYGGQNCRCFDPDHSELSGRRGCGHRNPAADRRGRGGRHGGAGQLQSPSAGLQVPLSSE